MFKCVSGRKGVFGHHAPGDASPKSTPRELTFALETGALKESMKADSYPPSPLEVSDMSCRLDFLITSHRALMVKELRSVAGLLCSSPPLHISDPSDFKIRLIRFSISWCLTDTLESLHPAVVNLKHKFLFDTFNMVVGLSARLLSDSYFSRGKQEIIDDYLKLQPALAACAEHCDVIWMDIEELVDSYKGKVATEFSRLTRQNASGNWEVIPEGELVHEKAHPNALVFSFPSLSDL